MAAVAFEMKGRVARVILDRPPLNVVDLATARELVAALERASAEHGLSAVVLAARGRAFCAGVDLRDHLPDRGAEMVRTFDRACAALLEIEAPVVAAVQGAALGGGGELAALSPEALRVAKRALRLGRARPGAGAIEAAERIYLEERLEAPDAIEGLTAFIEKRAPAWDRG